MFATIKDVDSDADKNSDNSDGKEFDENVDKSTDSYKSKDGKNKIKLYPGGSTTKKIKNRH